MVIQSTSLKKSGNGIIPRKKKELLVFEISPKEEDFSGSSTYTGENFANDLNMTLLEQVSFVKRLKMDLIDTAPHHCRGEIFSDNITPSIRLEVKRK